VETHSRADHLAGHARLHERTDAPVYLSVRSPSAFPHRPLGQGEELRAGGLALGVLETPGHTRDHLTLTLGDRIFTGDSLFVGGCGRTDLPGGDPNLLFDTFRARYDPLPDPTEVYPAHFGPKQGLPDGFSTTLGAERASNDALKIRDRAEFVRYMTEGWPPKPTDFDRILGANLAGPSGGA
jgi:glyoxylase-like metal-dependent hydrolase (beta-lactamase superfamily II)